MADKAVDMPDLDVEAVPPEQVQPTPTGKVKRPPSRYQLQMARSNLLLAGLFLAGAAAVYGLSLRKMPTQASAAPNPLESQVDSAILRFSQDPKTLASAPGAGKITQELLRTFYDQVGQRQVPLGKLRKNPFVFVPPVLSASVTPTTTPADTAAAKLAPTREKGQQEQLDALKRLRLQSVMMGRGNTATALISNNLLTVGQTIEGFTVKSIAPDAVVLTWQNKDFELKMP